MDEQLINNLHERRHMDDLRDRLARAEQDIKNAKENFHNFKTEDFSALKAEVKTMRGELNSKIDELRDLLLEFRDSADERVNSINLTMAKWMGAGGVLIFVGQLLIERFIK